MANKKTPKKTPQKSSAIEKKAPKTPRPSLTAAVPRKLKAGRYESFHLQKRLPKTMPKILGSYRLLFRSIKLLCKQWKLFGGILLIYIILELILVQGLSLITSGSSLDQTKHLLGTATNLATTSTSLFLLLVGNGTGNSSSSAYQFVLLLFVSLALIWTIRQYYLGVVVRIRDGFYRGMNQLVPFILVLLTVGVQLVPAAIGIILYTAVSNNGIAGTVVERVLWGLITIILIFVTVYLLTSSLFALYIVTLNDLTPLKALRMANKLVQNRRLLLIRKILFLPIAIFIIMGILVVPFLLFAVKAAPVAFFIVTAVMVALLHAYMYGLYRELLNE